MALTHCHRVNPAITNSAAVSEVVGSWTEGNFLLCLSMIGKVSLWACECRVNPNLICLGHDEHGEGRALLFCQDLRLKSKVTCLPLGKLEAPLLLLRST